jgi:hypothetical protein
MPAAAAVVVCADGLDIDDVVSSLLCLPLTSELDSRQFSYEPDKEESAQQQRQQQQEAPFGCGL